MKDIQKYREGSMSDEELERFTGKMVNLKLDNDLKNKWAGQLAQEHDLVRKPGAGGVFPLKGRLLWGLVSIAASILLITLFLPDLLRPEPRSARELASIYLEKDHLTDPTVRGGDAARDELRSRAQEAFNKGDYKTAIDLRLELINRTPGDISDEFFLALAYLNNDQATNSIPLFQKTLETAPANDNKFAEESAWFISLAYLKTGNLQAARDALLKIKEDEWRYAESRELLDKLEELK
ncbi:MAG: hypothetical protein H6562_08590 [Lewinellaceae bacterium]|nr:hypothetical protein [Lewinella sp.]MCB9278956.1 hypothetical protein [Lewinellaceae bacterium]